MAKVRKMLTLVWLEAPDRGLLEKVAKHCWLGTETEALVQCMRAALKAIQVERSAYRRHLPDGISKPGPQTSLTLRLDKTEKRAMELIRRLTRRDSTAATIRLAIRVGAERLLDGEDLLDRSRYDAEDDAPPA